MSSRTRHPRAGTSTRERKRRRELVSCSTDRLGRISSRIRVKRRSATVRAESSLFPNFPCSLEHSRVEWRKSRRNWVYCTAARVMTSRGILRNCFVDGGSRVTSYFTILQIFLYIFDKSDPARDSDCSSRVLRGRLSIFLFFSFLTRRDVTE